jgi:hypothetical protein
MTAPAAVAEAGGDLIVRREGAAGSGGRAPCGGGGCGAATPYESCS